MLETKYKVVRVYRESDRRQTIQKNLSREQAQALVKAFPNSPKSMVVFTAQ